MAMSSIATIDSQSLVAARGTCCKDPVPRPSSDHSLRLWFATALELYATAFNVFTGTIIAPKSISNSHSTSSSAVRALRYRSSSYSSIRRLAERLKMIWQTESRLLSSMEGFYSPVAKNGVEVGCRRLYSRPVSPAPSIDTTTPQPHLTTTDKHEVPQPQLLTEASRPIPFQHLQSAVPPRRTCKLIDPYRARLRRRHKLRPSHSQRSEEPCQLDTINEEQDSSDDCDEFRYDEEDDNDHMTVIVHDITDESSYCDMKYASSYLYTPYDDDDDDDEDASSDHHDPDAQSESFSLAWALHYQRVKMKTKMTKVKKRAMALVTKRM